jgi:hypothetical protein
VNARRLAAEIEARVGCGRWFVWPETGMPAGPNSSTIATLLVHGTLERRVLARHDPRRGTRSRGTITFEYRLSGPPREEQA